MARQLKVFSTPAGFVNAVVAAPSQKAALEAWGVRENVFANGTATIVTDPELIARALETPGQIVRVPIGSEEAILKGAKPPPRAATAGAPATKPKPAFKPAIPAVPTPPPPPPDRSPLTAAEAALAVAEEGRAKELKELDETLRALEAKRRDRETALDREIAAALSVRDVAASRYRAAGGSD